MLASKEVANPVAAFATDNNGTIIRLPAVPATGQANVTGQLVFGVGTQSNNALPTTATVVAMDQHGMFTTQYRGMCSTGCDRQRHTCLRVPGYDDSRIRRRPVHADEHAESDRDDRVD